MNKKKGKKANVLLENLIFIILNLVFLSILIFFAYSKLGAEKPLEEKYSKQIALILDSAKPEMKIILNMDDASEKAEKNKFPEKSIVHISKNIVTVKTREKGKESYSFFNDVEISNYYFDEEKNNLAIILKNYNEDK